MPSRQLAIQYGSIDNVTDHHRRKPRSFWPEIEAEYQPVLEDLEARGYEMTAFLRACLRMYVDDAAHMLALLARHWPDPRPEGNPQFRRRSAGDDDA